MPCSTRFIKSCAGKVKHKTILGAEYALAENRQNKNASVYKCKECDFFHIGTSATKKSKKLKLDHKQKGNNEHKRKYKTVKKFKY
jgi:hypothetical protein